MSKWPVDYEPMTCKGTGSDRQTGQGKGKGKETGERRQEHVSIRLLTLLRATRGAAF